VSVLSLPVPGFIDTARVYAPDPTTGDYTTLINANLICVLAVGGGKYEGVSAKDRAELAAWRKLLWDPAYDMPENAQIEVDGVRYNAVAGSFVAFKIAANSIIYRRGDFVRALT